MLKQEIARKYLELTAKLSGIFPSSPIPKMPEEVGVEDIVFVTCHFTGYHDKKDYGGFVRAMASLKGVKVTDAQVELAVPPVQEWMEFIVPIVRKEV